MDRALLHSQIPHTLASSDLKSLELARRGKVRDVYKLPKGDALLFVTSDRISAFDRILGTVPFKGELLTGLAAKRHVLAGALTLGEKKKLELARALATEPRLLLLDEVMGGVNRGEVDELMLVLQRIHASGVTIVMIEHLVEVIIALSMRVVVLNFGRKLYEGSPQDVVEHPDVIESYLGRPLEVDAA